MRSYQYQQVQWPTKEKLFEARTIGDYKIPIKAQEEMTMFREKEEVDISEGGMDENEGWASTDEYSRD